MSEKSTQDGAKLNKKNSQKEQSEKKTVQVEDADKQKETVSSQKQDSESAEVSEEKTEDKHEELQEELSELKQKYDKLEDKYLRAEAEMANMHTRFKKEQERLLKYDGQSLAKDVLPVIDNLNRALKIEVEDDASKQIKRGIELVFKDMEKALTSNHIVKIEALGQPFDPTKHQAVKSVQAEDGQKTETVVEVFQDGYMLKDRVLRPAMVAVAQ
ncbi:nucleotide exchange factor GrpE [Liquorilactobacillus uvarum]|uniref:nucleotide exchange factor GrpE n=1 Tax=Liquorilactobacillus uvarum TaxID=303240 RepID=UPI0028899F20|nr:nucleotide exchange factor GrpE [Liquorilactobacillus uvarum]